MNKKHIKYMVISVFGLLVLCTQNTNIAGGGTRGGNPVVVGVVRNENGTPVSGAIVTLAAKDADPLSDSAHGFFTYDTTDSNGRYAVTSPNADTLNIVMQHETGSGAFLGTLVPKTDTVELAPAPLSAMGSFVVSFPYKIGGGTIGLSGTPFRASITEGDTFGIFPSIPQHLSSNLLYRSASSNQSEILYANVVKRSMPEDTIYIEDGILEHLTLLLITTTEGADISEDVYDFPILVRLDSTHKNVLLGALDNQNNLRIVTEQKHLLPCEIETWDTASLSAALWINVDTIRGNDTTFLTMYWGNKLPGVFLPQNHVFDTTNGFESVYHLNDQSPATMVLDATPKSRNGQTATGTQPPTVAAGIIGGAQKFSGEDSRLEVPSPSLSNGVWSLSAWFLPTKPINQGRIVGDESGVRLSWGSYNLQQSHAKIHLDYSEDPSFKVCGYGPLAVTWHHVTAVCDTSSHECKLYVDGSFVCNTTWNSGTVSTIDGTKPLMIGGKYLDHYEGLIDEVRISRVTRSAAWIKLSYENQKANQSLVRFTN